jgi:hypothetical protein
MKFKIGDKVMWNGFTGTITEIVSEKKKRYKVLFDWILELNETDLESA